MIQEYDNKDIRDVIDKSFEAGQKNAMDEICNWLEDNLFYKDQSKNNNKNGIVFTPYYDSVNDFIKNMRFTVSQKLYLN